MKYSEHPQLRSWTPGADGGAPQGGYPGIGTPFTSGPPAYSPVQVLPAQAQPAAAAAPAKGGGLSSMLNIGEIKNLVERMGGIDGILNNIGKLQKIMVTVQQMAPMIKLLVGKNKSGGADGFDDFARPRRRRRRRHRRGNNRRRPGGRASVRRTGGRRRP